jgi:hypothetical protein
MSASDTSSSWSTLLAHLQPSQEIVIIRDEGRFHRAFKKVCSEIRERDPERLLAKFLRHHAKIRAFIGALEESAGFDENRCLGQTFWSVSLWTVRVRRLHFMVAAVLRHFADINSDSFDRQGERVAFPELLPYAQRSFPLFRTRSLLVSRRPESPSTSSASICGIH